jgi:hypothetical protein
MGRERSFCGGKGLWFSSIVFNIQSLELNGS